MWGTGDAGSDRSDDELNSNWSRANGYNTEKFDMKVPDRIIVRGQDQHIGTKALPRELQLEASTGPVQPDPEMIRMLTPPRTITLNQMNLQAAHDASMQDDKNNPENDDETLVIYSNRARFTPSHIMPNGTIAAGILDSSNNIANRSAALDATGFYDPEVQAELDHFRDQFKRLGHRLTICEADIKERREREQYIMYAGGIYLALQIFKWLFRSNQH